MLLDGEVVLQQEGTHNVHERPFANHGNSRHMTDDDGVRSEGSTKEKNPMRSEGEPDLDKIAGAKPIQIQTIL